MEELNEYRQRLMERFENFAKDLAETLEQISAEALHLPVMPGGWSAHKIVAHLRDTEQQVFLPRLERILNEDQPVLESFDRTSWTETHYRPDEPLETILAAYQDLRLKELTRLRQMPPVAWSRTARHPGWGVRTVQWLVEHNLSYAEDHLNLLKGQIEQPDSEKSQ